MARVKVARHGCADSLPTSQASELLAVPQYGIADRGCDRDGSPYFDPWTGFQRRVAYPCAATVSAGPEVGTKAHFVTCFGDPGLPSGTPAALVAVREEDRWRPRPAALPNIRPQTRNFWAGLSIFGQAALLVCVLLIGASGSNKVSTSGVVSAENYSSAGNAEFVGILKEAPKDDVRGRCVGHLHELISVRVNRNPPVKTFPRCEIKLAHRGGSFKEVGGVGDYGLNHEFTGRDSSLRSPDVRNEELRFLPNRSGRVNYHAGSELQNKSFLCNTSLSINGSKSLQPNFSLSIDRFKSPESDARGSNGGGNQEQIGHYRWFLPLSPISALLIGCGFIWGSVELLLSDNRRFRRRCWRRIRSLGFFFGTVLLGVVWMWAKQ
jgi:hypothetical protein